MDRYGSLIDSLICLPPALAWRSIAARCEVWFFTYLSRAVDLFSDTYIWCLLLVAGDFCGVTPAPIMVSGVDSDHVDQGGGRDTSTLSGSRAAVMGASVSPGQVFGPATEAALEEAPLEVRLRSQSMRQQGLSRVTRDCVP